MKTKKRENQNAIDEDRKRLAKRDGIRCMEHWRRGVRDIAWTIEELVVHHKDNDPSNKSLENKELLCKGCNHILDPRGKGGQFGAYGSLTLEKAFASSAEMQRNVAVFERWKEYMRFFMEEHDDGYSLDDFVDESSYIFGVSQVTVKKRWIRAMTCRLAPYAIDMTSNMIMHREGVRDVEMGPSTVSNAG